MCVALCAMSRTHQRNGILLRGAKGEERTLLSGSSQGDSSVMRVRLEGRKKPIRNSPLQIRNRRK